MHDCANKGPVEIVARVDAILLSIGILKNPYIESLSSGEMSREEFQRTQRQFYFAVDFFSRPMSALLMRLPRPEQRLGILGNVVEEHGDFQASAFHEATFRRFLSALGDSRRPDRSEIGPAVHAFNSAIMGACIADDLPIGIACLGIIEHAFADISARIAGAVIKHRWLSEDELVHYSLHAEIDKQHAADFFVLLEEDWRDEAGRILVEQGLQLGGHLFDRLYRDLMTDDRRVSVASAD
jgi:pyrroloquinoline-quinone synthase